MTINVYDIGQLVPISALFEDADGVDTDPSTVTLEVLDPAGNTRTYLYGASPTEVIRDSAGNYHVDVEADQAGDWFYKWSSTGSGQAAQEGQFMVAPGHFA